MVFDAAICNQTPEKHQILQQVILLLWSL